MQKSIINSHLQPGSPARPSVDSISRVIVPPKVGLTHRRMNAALKNTREHCTHQATAGEDCGALAELFSLVPATENVVASNKGGGFEDGLEEPQDHNLPWMLCEAGTKGDQAPGNNAAREIDARGQLLESKIVGNLSKDVATVEYYRHVSLVAQIVIIGDGVLLVLMMFSSLPLKFKSSLMPLT